MMSVKDSIQFFNAISLNKNQEKIAKNIFKNCIERLEFLAGVGLDYMTVSRKSSTLS
jgi:excinuclease ABC subunit A